METAKSLWLISALLLIIGRVNSQKHMQKGDIKIYKINKGTGLLIFFLLIFGVFSSAKAAQFFAAPPEIYANQETEIVIGLDTENETINTVELNLIFSPNDFLIKDVSNGNSVISFWIEEPKFSNEKGEINFSGIIPGGYFGRGGDLIKVDLVAKKTGTAIFNIKNSKVLLNDGQGTDTKVSTSDLKLNVVEAPLVGETPSKIKDTEPPETFTPQIVKDPNIFGGKYSLVFATQDKRSGINHYEVQEKRAFQIFGLKFGKAKWIVAESPYLLIDQNLKSYIYVKAVDRMGNERIAVLPPQNLAWYENYSLWVIIILLIIFLFIFRKRLWKKERS